LGLLSALDMISITQKSDFVKREAQNAAPTKYSGCRD